MQSQFKSKGYGMVSNCSRRNTADQTRSSNTSSHRQKTPYPTPDSKARAPPVPENNLQATTEARLNLYKPRQWLMLTLKCNRLIQNRSSWCRLSKSIKYSTSWLLPHDMVLPTHGQWQRFRRSPLLHLPLSSCSEILCNFLTGISIQWNQMPPVASDQSPQAHESPSDSTVRFNWSRRWKPCHDKSIASISDRRSPWKPRFRIFNQN